MVQQDTQFVSELRQSPTGQRIIQEREEALLSERRQWADDIKAAESELEKDLPALRKAESEAAEEVQRADAALRDAIAAHAEAHARRMGRVNQADRQRGEAEAALVRTAPVEIIQFQREMMEWDDKLRRDGLSIANAGERQRALEAVRSARQEAEELKVRAMGADACRRAIAKLRAALPALGV